MTTKEEIIKTLHEAADGLLMLKDDFFIFGSAALSLAGIDIETVNDIDIAVSQRDADTLKETWQKRKKDLPEKESTLFRSDLTCYDFGPMDIEISGNMEIHTKNGWQPFVIYDYEVLPIGKLLVKVPTPEEQKNILLLFGRGKDLERIAIIDKHLSSINPQKNKNMEKFVTVKIFNFPTDMHMAKSFLESNGILCFAKDEFINQVQPLYTQAMNGIKLEVPADQAEEAINLLIEGGFAKKEDFETPQPIITTTKVFDRIKNWFKKK